MSERIDLESTYSNKTKQPIRVWDTYEGKEVIGVTLDTNSFWCTIEVINT